MEQKHQWFPLRLNLDNRFQLSPASSVDRLETVIQSLLIIQHVLTDGKDAGENSNYLFVWTRRALSGPDIYLGKTYAKLFDNAIFAGFPTLRNLTSKICQAALVNKWMILFIAKHCTVKAFRASIQNPGARNEQFVRLWKNCSVSKVRLFERVPKSLVVKPFGLNVGSPQINVGTRFMTRQDNRQKGFWTKVCPKFVNYIVV